MSDFVAGFSARQNAAAAALQQAFAPPGGFAPSACRACTSIWAPGRSRSVRRRRPAAWARRRPTMSRPAIRAISIPPAAITIRPRAGTPCRVRGSRRTGGRSDHRRPCLGPCGGLCRRARRRPAPVPGAGRGEARDSRMVDHHRGAVRAHRSPGDGRTAAPDRADAGRQAGGEIGVDAERLAGRIEGAMDLLSDAKEAAMLRVHPDDVAMRPNACPRPSSPSATRMWSAAASSSKAPRPSSRTAPRCGSTSSPPRSTRFPFRNAEPFHHRLSRNHGPGGLRAAPPWWRVGWPPMTAC